MAADTHTGGRNLLEKGEVAIIAPGVEGWAATNRLINTVREDVRCTKNNLLTADAAATYMFSKLPDGGVHQALAKEIMGCMESEKAHANKGECCNADISEEISALIAARLTSQVQSSMFEINLARHLAALPGRYDGNNLEMQEVVRGSKLVRPPHAEVLSGSRADSYGDSEEQTLYQRLLKERKKRESSLQDAMASKDYEVAELCSVEEEKRQALDEAKALLAEKRKLRSALEGMNIQPQGGAVDGAGGGQPNQQQPNALAQQLQQEVDAAEAQVTARETELSSAAARVDTRREELDVSIDKKAKELSTLIRNLEDIKKADAGGGNAPLKLQEIYYTGADGAEQAIFLPVLKALIIFRCLVCVPTPTQIQAILINTKQGRALFTSEPVPASEDIAQYGARVQNYVEAAQLVGYPLDGPNLLIEGLKGKMVQERLAIALSVLPTPPKNLQELARMAMSIQAKEEGASMVRAFRGGYGGKGVLTAGYGADGADAADEGVSGNSYSKLEAQMSELASAMKSVAAMAAGGFKQANKFGAGGGSSSSGNGGGYSGGGISGGYSSGGKHKEARPAQQNKGTTEAEEEHERRRKCKICYRWHRGDCFPVHEACGRRHNPASECYGKDYSNKPEGARRWDNRDRRQEKAAGAAAAGREINRVLTDE